MLEEVLHVRVEERLRERASGVLDVRGDELEQTTSRALRLRARGVQRARTPEQGVLDGPLVLDALLLALLVGLRPTVELGRHERAGEPVRLALNQRVVVLRHTLRDEPGAERRALRRAVTDDEELVTGEPCGVGHAAIGARDSHVVDRDRHDDEALARAGVPQDVVGAEVRALTRRDRNGDVRRSVRVPCDVHRGEAREELVFQPLHLRAECGALGDLHQHRGELRGIGVEHRDDIHHHSTQLMLSHEIGLYL